MHLISFFVLPTVPLHSPGFAVFQKWFFATKQRVFFAMVRNMYKCVCVWWPSQFLCFQMEVTQLVQRSPRAALCVGKGFDITNCICFCARLLCNVMEEVKRGVRDWCNNMKCIVCTGTYSHIGRRCITGEGCVKMLKGVKATMSDQSTRTRRKSSKTPERERESWTN